LLIGRWSFQWGSWLDGWIEFRADGTYLSRHQEGWEPHYAGWWSLHGDTITLHEGPFVWGVPLSIIGCYPVKSIRTDRFPLLTGWYAGTEVRLRR
jgi:hypothetical protein